MCVFILTIIGPDNNLSPSTRQIIIWNNAWTMLIGTLGTNFSDIVNVTRMFSFKKLLLKISSGKWRPFCLGLNQLKQVPVFLEQRKQLLLRYDCYFTLVIDGWIRLQLIKSDRASFSTFRIRTVWKFRSGVAWWILCMDVFVSRRSYELVASRTSLVCGFNMLVTETRLTVRWPRPVETRVELQMIQFLFPMCLPALLFSSRLRYGAFLVFLTACVIKSGTLNKDLNFTQSPLFVGDFNNCCSVSWKQFTTQQWSHKNFLQHASLTHWGPRKKWPPFSRRHFQTHFL